MDRRQLSQTLLDWASKYSHPGQGRKTFPQTLLEWASKYKHPPQPPQAGSFLKAGSFPQPGSSVKDASIQQSGTSVNNVSIQDPRSFVRDVHIQQTGSSVKDLPLQQPGSPAKEALLQQPRSSLTAPGSSINETFFEQPISSAKDGLSGQSGSSIGDGSLQQSISLVKDGPLEKARSYTHNVSMQQVKGLPSRQPGSPVKDLSSQQPGSSDKGLPLRQPGLSAKDPSSRQSGPSVQDESLQEPRLSIHDESLQEPRFPVRDTSLQQPESSVKGGSLQQPKSSFQDITLKQPSISVNDASCLQPQFSLNGITLQQPTSLVKDLSTQKPRSSIKDVFFKQPTSSVKDVSWQQSRSSVIDVSIQQPGSSSSAVALQQPAASVDDVALRQPKASIVQVSLQQPRSVIRELCIQQPRSSAKADRGTQGSRSTSLQPGLQHSSYSETDEKENGSSQVVHAHVSVEDVPLPGDQRSGKTSHNLHYVEKLAYSKQGRLRSRQTVVLLSSLQECGDQETLAQDGPDASDVAKNTHDTPCPLLDLWRFPLRPRKMKRESDQHEDGSEVLRDTDVSPCRGGVRVRRCLGGARKKADRDRMTGAASPCEAVKDPCPASHWVRPVEEKKETGDSGQRQDARDVSKEVDNDPCPASHWVHPADERKTKEESARREDTRHASKKVNDDPCPTSHWEPAREEKTLTKASEECGSSSKVTTGSGDAPNSPTLQVHQVVDEKTTTRESERCEGASEASRSANYDPCPASHWEDPVDDSTRKTEPRNKATDDDSEYQPCPSCCYLAAERRLKAEDAERCEDCGDVIKDTEDQPCPSCLLVEERMKERNSERCEEASDDASDSEPCPSCCYLAAQQTTRESQQCEDCGEELNDMQYNSCPQPQCWHHYLCHHGHAAHASHVVGDNSYHFHPCPVGYPWQHQSGEQQMTDSANQGRATGDDSDKTDYYPCPPTQSDPCPPSNCDLCHPTNYVQLPASVPQPSPGGGNCSHEAPAVSAHDATSQKTVSSLVTSEGVGVNNSPRSEPQPGSCQEYFARLMGQSQQLAPDTATFVHLHGQKWFLPRCTCFRDASCRRSRENCLWQKSECGHINFCSPRPSHALGQSLTPSYHFLSNPRRYCVSSKTMGVPENGVQTVGDFAAAVYKVVFGTPSEESARSEDACNTASDPAFDNRNDNARFVLDAVQNYGHVTGSFCDHMTFGKDCLVAFNSFSSGDSCGPCYSHGPQEPPELNELTWTSCHMTCWFCRTKLLCNSLYTDLVQGNCMIRALGNLSELRLTLAITLQPCGGT